MIIIEIIPHGVISILIKRNTLKMAAESGEKASREILYRGYDKNKIFRSVSQFTVNLQ